MRPHATAALLAVLATTGCGSKDPPLSAPSYDPDGMARAALQQYDKNKNGKIDGAELDACPALKGALAVIDTNKDKGVSVDELTERFRGYESAGIGAVGVSGVVTLNGDPLGGAVVTFVPEDFMKGSIKGGSGTSDAGGAVAVTGEGGVPGLACGMYKVTVSKRSAGGGEELPARYHTATTLGWEVPADGRGGGPLELRLTSP